MQLLMLKIICLKKVILRASNQEAFRKKRRMKLKKILLMTNRIQFQKNFKVKKKNVFLEIKHCTFWIKIGKL